MKVPAQGAGGDDPGSGQDDGNNTVVTGYKSDHGLDDSHHDDHDDGGDDGGNGH